MESDPDNTAAPNGDSIAELVNEYFDRRQAGENLTPEQFAAEHPALADELKPYLEGLALIDRARSVTREENQPPSGPAPGTMPAIDGYDLQAEIGRGGMGVVYRALQIATKRIVAVKVMLAGPFASEASRRRFAREVELAARLDHRGIVRILESGTVGGQPYYAMDYVEGARLDAYLAREQPGVPMALRLFAQICSMIDAAHQRSVVHRDLKPANILVDAKGDPHILDFGLAKAINHAEEVASSYRTLSAPGQIMGTLAYLSPEQAAGRPADIDTRTDVYSIGVILYEALTGHLPLDISGRPSDVIQRILADMPIPPCKVSQRVDAELETILLKALAKEKGERYASAKDLADDIDRYLKGEPILARRTSSFYIVRKKLRKHRTRILAGFVVLAVALGGLWGGVTWRAARLQERRTQETAAARHEALRIVQMLEKGDLQGSRAQAEVFDARHSWMPEAPLISAQARLRGRDVDQAIARLERVPAHHLHSWAAKALLAEIHRSVGNIQRAAELAAQARRAMPDTAQAWYFRSMATLDQRSALRYARTATQRDPRHVWSWARVTSLQMVLDDLSGALLSAEQLIALDPENASWHTLKGDIHLLRAEYEQSITMYTNAIRIGPRHSAPYPHRALAYRRLKQYDKAIADYDRVLARGGEDEKSGLIWYRYQRATPLWMSGRMEEAVADYERVRAVRGHAHYADARRVLILHALGRSTEAEEVLAMARRDVEDSWLATILACLSSQRSPASLAAVAAAEEPARQCEAFYYAGEVCLLNGANEDACRWFQQAVDTGIDLDPHTSYPTPMNEHELARWRLETLCTAATQPDQG